MGVLSDLVGTPALVLDGDSSLAAVIADGDERAPCAVVEGVVEQHVEHLPHRCS